MNNKLAVKQLVLRLSLLIILYQVCRIIFYLFNKSLFPKIGIIEFLGGLRFDLTAIFFSNSLFIVLSIIPGNFKYTTGYQKFLKILFFLVNAVFIATNLIDVEYYKFTGKRSTFSLITASGMEKDVLRLIPIFLKKFWYLFALYFVLLFLFWKIIPTAKYNYKANGKGIQKNLIEVLSFCAFIGLIILFGRGGFQRAPLKTVDAVNYTKELQNTTVVLNTPFTIFRSLSKKDNLIKVNYFTNENIKNIYQPLLSIKSERKFDKKNIVIIILESFGKENINKKLTPFFNSLLTQGRYYTNAHANGLKSIDAVPSVITSIPCLMEVSYISSPYSFNKVDGFNSILEKEGYTTAFFHGAFNGSQNFNEFANITGYDRYYGKNEYPEKDGFDGVWGVFDEEFLQFMAKELNTLKQPFFSTVFTISSHEPFTIPKKHKNKFLKGNRDIHESLAYSDYALKKFFETAKKQSWYKNTVFVLTADHTSRGKGKTDYFNTDIGTYSIPIIIFDPSNPHLKEVDTKLMGQVDILPEILNYLSYNGEIFSFGNLPQSKERIVANYNEGVFKFLINDYYLTFDGDKILTVYNYKSDSLLRNKLQYYPKNQLETKIKAYIQQYNNRVIDNKLSIK